MKIIKIDKLYAYVSPRELENTANELESLMNEEMPLVSVCADDLENKISLSFLYFNPNTSSYTLKIGGPTEYFVITTPAALRVLANKIKKSQTKSIPEEELTFPAPKYIVNNYGAINADNNKMEICFAYAPEIIK